jgi:hypothetical protein
MIYFEHTKNHQLKNELRHESLLKTYNTTIKTIVAKRLQFKAASLTKVILVQSIIPVGFRLSKRLGSHEREIIEVGREVTFDTLTI